MQELRVIGVEGGSLLVTSDGGERFSIPVDEILQTGLRASTPTANVARKLSPREIQEQIRSGLSAEDVAATTGMPIEHVARYEGPILAEREHIVNSALAVPVHTALDTGPVSGMSFGAAIQSRLRAIGAVNERWASWKDRSGWVVKLSFTADQIDHDARWSFDPRRQALSPLNNEATTLSQQGDVPAQLVPRLRAVSPSPEPETSRFDSGAFAPVEPEPPVSRFAPQRPQPLQADSNQTADLLDALRRRRGEREAASYGDDDVRSGHPSTGSIRVIDVPMPEVEPDVDADEDPEGQRPTLPQPTVAPAPAPAPASKSRKGRASMPSWDDIVFGARPDDGA
jgi:hypothetical protein